MRLPMGFWAALCCLLAGLAEAAAQAPADATEPSAAPPPAGDTEMVGICREVGGMANLAVLRVLERRYKGTLAGECIAARIEQIEATAAPVPKNDAQSAPKSGPAPAPVTKLAADSPPPFTEGTIATIKGALNLTSDHLVLWAPMEAQLRIAFAQRQKMRGSAFQPFYASLDTKQRDRASVLLKPVVAEPWPVARYTVHEQRDKLGSTYRFLMHGNILRGAQRIRDEAGGPVDDTMPATYYYPGSPMAKAVAKRRELLAARGEKGRYGVVGVWAGTTACYKHEGETWRFFESDPAAVRIARDPKIFTFISTCQPDIDIAIGETRATLAKEADSSFDLIIVDTTYTAEGIQVQVMTKEALELLLAKLKPDGIVLYHTSSKHIDLSGVLGANLKLLPAGTAGIWVGDYDANGTFGQSMTENVIIARSADTLGPYRSSLKKVYELSDNGLHAWTDDFADIWAALRKK